MAKGLKISTELTLPADTVTSTLVVYGGKGMGKTNAGGVLVEELSAAGLRWSVLDPIGVWWGMRHSPDGKGKGVECLILGGAHGDIPIEPTGGAVVADLVVDERVNVIIDISRKTDGTMWSIGERIRFAAEYGAQLYKRQGSLVNGRRREPLLQVIDEAARFIPQMVRSGDLDAAKCESVWSSIAEEGRNVGLGLALLTQRSARLNKNVAELADVMMAFRTVGPNSVAAITDWLGAHVPKERIRSIVETVRALPVGSCLVVSPGWLGIEKVVPFRMRHTFDSSATPKPGQKATRVQGDGAKPNLNVYAERMKETIERAKDNSPVELKAKVRKLEAELAKKPTHIPATVTVQNEPAVKENIALKAENKELKRKVVDRQRKSEKLATFLEKMMLPLVTSLNKVLEEFRSESPLAPEPASPSAPAAKPLLARFAEPVRPLAFPAKRIMPTKLAVFDGDAKPLTGNALKMAQIAAGYGDAGIDKHLLATLCGMSMNGGGFGARLSEARTSGAINTTGSHVFATEEGIARYAGTFQAPQTTEEVVALWRPKLTGKALAMFDHLVALAGESVSRAELAEAVGMEMSGGGFGARLSELRSTQLLDERGCRVALNRELLFM